MITVVGSINLDLTARVPRLPEPGETVPGGSFATAPGGKGANQALAARRAGAEVRMVGAVGADAFAGEALALLKPAGVDLSAVKTVDGATGIALILVGGDGENMIAVVPGANADVTPDILDRIAFARGEHVLLQLEIPIATVEKAIAAARSAGAVSILNTAPFRPETASFVAEADVVVANETEFDHYAEALGLEGADRGARIRAFAARTGRAVVVTLGADGVLAAQGDGFFHVPAMRIVPVDTVGAGDTFCGYLAQGLEAGLPLHEAARRAGIAGSLACLKPGAQPAIPLAADVEAAFGGSGG
jgi:ribokinase